MAGFSSQEEPIKNSTVGFSSQEEPKRDSTVVSIAKQVLGKEFKERFQPRNLPGVLPAAGTALGLAVTGMNPLGGVAGYYTGSQAERATQGKISTPSEQISDLNMGMIQEILPALLQKPIGAVGGYLKSKAPQIYESALKPLTTLKQSVRDKRVDTALKEGIPVSKGGLEKSKATIKDLNDQITQRLSDLKGTTISREKALQPVKDFYEGIPSKNITPQKEQGIVAQYIKEVQESNPSPDIPIQQAQAFKQTLNRELNEYYTNLSKGKISPEPALARTKASMANGLREEISNMFPEIKGLNAREASLIELNKSLERAVNRITNRELIPLAVQIATGRTEGVLKTIAIKMIDQPYLKSRLAIALSKATPQGISRVGQYLTKSELISEASPRAKGGPVQKGKPYIVGEKGPEIFVPKQDGKIISNKMSRKKRGKRFD